MALLAAIGQQRKDIRAAISNYNVAISLNPDSPSTRYLLAVALLNNREFAQAKEEFSRLAELGPYRANAHASLGEIFEIEKKHPEAIQQYRDALRTRPDWPVVLNNLAWLRATSPEAQLRDGPEAVRLAERACELSRYEEPLFIGTLAAAYAEVGRFPDAIAACKRAQALALQKGLTGLAQRNADLLKLYEAANPYREAP